MRRSEPIEEILFQIERQRRKTTAIHVLRDGTVVARAPRWVPAFWIRKFVQRHLEWIRKTQARIRQEGPPVADRWAPGQRQEMKRIVEERLRDCLPGLATKMNVQPAHVSVGFARHRWGSCSVRGRLRFNARLALVQPELLEYVIVHELAHLREMNHSSRFWQIVAQVLPDYKTRRSQLRRGSTIVEG